MLGIVHLPTHSSTACPEGSLFRNLRFPARRHLFGREAESQAWSSLHGAIDRTAARRVTSSKNASDVVWLYLSEQLAVGSSRGSGLLSPASKVRGEIAVGIGPVNHEPVREVEEPQTSAHRVVALEGDKHTGAKVEGHIHAAGVRLWHVMREGEEPAIDIEDGLPTPSDARYKLQPNASPTPIGVPSAVRCI